MATMAREFVTTHGTRKLMHEVVDALRAAGVKTTPGKQPVAQFPDGSKVRIRPYNGDAFIVGPEWTKDEIKADPRWLGLCLAVDSCWQAIGQDYEEGGGGTSKAEMVEVCLDANRLRMYPGGAAGETADKFVNEVSSAGGFALLCQLVVKQFDY